MDFEHGRPLEIEPGNHVLVVDDEPSVRELITEVLELAGFEVVSVGNGLEALEHLKVHSAPSCILLDHDMPEMNGEQFRKAQQCSPQLRDIPVILMTATQYIERKADELQVKQHLPKPFDIDQLVEVVASCSLQDRVA